LVLQSLRGNCCLHLSQNDDAILCDDEPEVYLLHTHRKNQNLPLLSPGIQDFGEHEFAVCVPQLVHYVDTQDVDTQAQ
jgi:hypothetical protein